MKAIVTGGGTGGHIYPAIAIADELKRRYPDAEILYVGTEHGMCQKGIDLIGHKLPQALVGHSQIVRRAAISSCQTID